MLLGLSGVFAEEPTILHKRTAYLRFRERKISNILLDLEVAWYIIEALELGSFNLIL